MYLINNEGKKAKLKPGMFATLFRDEGGEGKSKVVIWSIALFESHSQGLKFVFHEGAHSDNKLPFPESCLNQTQDVMEPLFLMWVKAIACVAGLDFKLATRDFAGSIVAAVQFTK